MQTKKFDALTLHNRRQKVLAVQNGMAQAKEGLELAIRGLRACELGDVPAATIRYMEGLEREIRQMLCKVDDATAAHRVLRDGVDYGKPEGPTAESDEVARNIWGLFRGEDK